MDGRRRDCRDERGDSKGESGPAGTGAVFAEGCMIRKLIRWIFKDILDELAAIREEIALGNREAEKHRRIGLAQQAAAGKPMRMYENLQPLGPLTGRF